MINYVRAFQIFNDLYEPFESADETLALELRFIDSRKNIPPHSTWVIIDDLRERYAEFKKALHVYNNLFRLDAYVSVNAHRWEAVREKAEAKGTLDVKGDSKTVYPKIVGFTLDIDVLKVHAGQSTAPYQDVKEFYEAKLKPFLDVLGLPPRYVLFTGGGVQLRWKADDLYPIRLLDELEALNPIINAYLQPEGKSDNVFDYPRVARVPLSVNWKYGEPIKGKILYMSKEETDLHLFLQTLRALGRELGLVVKKPKKPTKPRLKVPVTPGMRKIDVDLVYTALKPFYIPNFQNDLLIRLFSVLALYKVDIYQALELLSKFVHDPQNTPGHVKNRLDHLTYAYGRVFNNIHKTPLTQIYGEDLYERLAEFYNSLVADLGISYKPPDFKRGLEAREGKVSSWRALYAHLMRVAKIIPQLSPGETEIAVSIALKSIKYAMEVV